jgi:hypothetical protein
MPFAPTITHDSTSQKGVKFTVHRIGLGRRTDIEFQVLKHSQRMRELEADSPQATDQERDLREKLAIAYRKASAMLDAAKGLPPEQAGEAIKAHEAVVAEEVDPLTKELTASIPLDVRKARAVIDEEYNAVDSRVKAAWITAGLISISCGDLDGMTAEQLLDYGPPELAVEIYTALINDGKLRGAETKNWQSPTISGPVVDGASQNTTAPDVEVPLAATT